MKQLKPNDMQYLCKETHSGRLNDHNNFVYVSLSLSAIACTVVYTALSIVTESYTDCITLTA